MGNDVAIGGSYLRFIKHVGTSAGVTPAEGGFEMFARAIQVRVALLAVIALGVVVGFSPTRAAAFTCPQNLTSSCFVQPSVQASQVTVVQKVRHRAARKHSSSRCPYRNPYLIVMRCR
jgi:hypothetical protein